MWKSVAGVAAALAITGSSIVYAQQHYGGPGMARAAYERHQMPTAEDLAAFTDARIAGLKAGLALTPEQAKNWPPFEQALRDMAQIRNQRRLAREQESRDTDQGSPFDRLSQRADEMGKTSAALKKVAEAGAPLYQSLTDAQKARLRKLSWMLGSMHPVHAFRDEGGGRFRHFGHGWRFGSSETVQGAKVE